MVRLTCNTVQMIFKSGSANALCMSMTHSAGSFQAPFKAAKLVSFSVQVRLSTSLPGLLSGSTQKYPSLSI